jgi:hypothetical protein
MFGGLAFLADGHILVAVSRKGLLLVRVASAAERDRVLREPGITPMIMGKKMVDRFVYVDARSIASTPALRKWIARSSKALSTEE